jgi:hypothetical protein
MKTRRHGDAAARETPERAAALKAARKREKAARKAGIRRQRYPDADAIGDRYRMGLPAAAAKETKS